MKGKIAYVVADLEGSTGAWTKAHTLLATPEWQEARVELTRDLNAVAGALFERGVKGVGVKDFSDFEVGDILEFYRMEKSG